MKRAVAALLVLLALSCAAQAFGFGLGNRFGRLGAQSGRAAPPAPPLTGALLLEDGSSILLLENGTDNFCLEGGC